MATTIALRIAHAHGHEKECTPLAAELLRRRCDLSTAGFETSADLAHLDEYLGQERAVAAVQFAIGMRRPGYNLYALGDTGTGRHELVNRMLRAKAKDDQHLGTGAT
jgi:hypothetical protein